MRLFLIFYFVLCGSNLFSQLKVRHYDYFDFESSYDDYANVYSQFQEEGIKGNVKELRKISSRIDLHLRLNNQGEIVECLEYADNGSRLSRVKIYANRKIIKETEFNSDNKKEYTFYKYNKSGKLISKTYSRDRGNRRSTSTIRGVYNDKDQLVLRNFGKKINEKFIYEGDSIEWKLINTKDKLVKSVARRFKKPGYELVTFYKVDTFSNASFKERIVARSEFETRWDNNGNIIEIGEYSYDSSRNRILRRISNYEYNDKQLTKSRSVYNTDQLKGESSDEYFYDKNGFLQLKVHKNGRRIDKIQYEYDEQGDVIREMGFTFRYSYDSNENWILKESFHGRKSSSTRIRNGVATTQKFEDDTWLTEDKREILYF